MKKEYGRQDKVSWVSRGFRDVRWCPYMNEPFIIQYKLGTNEGMCPLCDSFEADTHEFICSIHKTPIDTSSMRSPLS